MKFHNTRVNQELSFTIMDKTYKVDADGEVEIDPAHVPYVISRGVALEPVTRKSAALKAEAPKPVAKDKPVVDTKVAAPKEEPAKKE